MSFANRGKRRAVCQKLSVLVGLLGWTLLAQPRFAAAQEVSGIYTDATTKDLGEKTKIDWLKGIKFRGWVESSYSYNFNRVRSGLANAHQGESAVKARDLTIEGHAFHGHHNSFTFDLGEIEIEKVPEKNGVGFKVDFAVGDIQDVIVDTIKATSPTGVSDFDKMFQHASISYVAPIGNGLRLDFGKFVTHIGGETIESIKNRNFSHAFFYTYAIPFQDSGLRMNYAFNSKFYSEVYVLNGWNVTLDNNPGKTFGYSIGLTPTPKFSLYANYLGGPERNDNKDDWRHLGDFQIVYTPFKALQTMLNIDVGKDENAIGAGKDAFWSGYTLYLRGNSKDRFFPTLRVEYYNDPDGFTTGIPQHLWGFTFTPDYKLGIEEGLGVKLLVRPEIRYDTTSGRFFSHENNFHSRNHQLTVGVGVVAYF